MCVICVKPTDTLFPSKETLQNCFFNNDDGAGFMYTFQDKVHIQKGLMTFESFWNCLEQARQKTGDNVPYVMHFRISTQGHHKECTHPFPLSSKMENLKKLKGTCSIGVAHNGVIRLTSDGAKDYSDTMKFITDYLYCIVDGDKQWYKNNNKLKLVERLTENNRLAILDANGHIVTIGKGWIKDKDGCMYSNNSYSYKKQVTVSYSYSPWYQNDYDFNYSSSKSSYDLWLKKNRQKTETTTDITPKHKWSMYKNHDGVTYTFSHFYCPYTEEDNDAYCTCCTSKTTCPYVKALMCDKA